MKLNPIEQDLIIMAFHSHGVKLRGPPTYLLPMARRLRKIAEISERLFGAGKKKKARW